MGIPMYPMFHYPYFWDSAQHEWLKHWFDKREIPEQMFGWWKIGNKSRLDSLLDELRMTSDLQPCSLAAVRRWLKSIEFREPDPTPYTCYPTLPDPGGLEWSCG